MQLKKFLYFFLCLSLATQAQNLVSNGSFEIYSSCPTGISQIINATGWSNAAPATSPDYHNSCTSSNSVDVPSNAFGYQQGCCGGLGYAGLYSYSSFGNPNQGREYVSIKLNDTLQANKKYLASMYVSKSNNFDYAIATLGIYFTNTQIQAGAGMSFINVPNPQVKNTTLLDDTTNWILIQDTLIGTGSELHLTIGNFSYDSLSDTAKVGGSGVFFGQAYYYIDGVSVYEISGACSNDWDAGYNKYIFAGDSIRLGALNTDSSVYTWVNSAGGNTYLNSNSDPHPWSTPTVTTTYYVTKTCPNNNTFSDTITVFVQQALGVNEIKSENVLTIYPNPNNGNFFLYYNLKENAAVELTDISGKLIGKYNLSANSNRIQVTNESLENGIYFIQIKSGNKMFSDKIIIAK